MSDYRKLSLTFVWSTFILIAIILFASQVGAFTSQEKEDRGPFLDPIAFNDGVGELGEGEWTAPQEIASSPKILHDNGPMVTCEGCGVGGADASEAQTNIGLTTLGFGHQMDLGYWVADEFTILDAEGWAVDHFIFYAFQTGSTTTSTMEDVRWVIYDDKPDAGGNLVANGSGLETTGWTNIYRTTTATTGSDIDNPIMFDKVNTNVLYLPVGTYWIAWQTDGSLTSGPWLPPISIEGQTTTGNAIWSDDDRTTWTAVTDQSAGTPQGFPFVIYGSLGLGGTLTCNGPDVTFDHGIPIDWTQDSSTGPIYWTLTDDPTGCDDRSPYEVGDISNAPGACASSDTLSYDYVDYDAQLWTNAIDLSDVASATLDLRYRHRIDQPSVFDIDVSSDGQTWTNKFRNDSGSSPGGDPITIDLASYLGNSEVFVRFRYYNYEAWDWYAQVDDVGLSCSFGSETFLPYISGLP